jgi:hypothetical protein
MPHRALVDTKEYENGKVASTKGSWEAGVDGAKPGIIMPADPKVGQSYYQEYYPGEAMDMARVLSLDASVTVPYGSFDHALESREWTPLQPGFSEKKYYVRGVGPLGNPEDQGTDRCKAQVSEAAARPIPLRIAVGTELILRVSMSRRKEMIVWQSTLDVKATAMSGTSSG